MSDVDDIRAVETTQADVAAFISSHRVKRIARPDRILGCPHQEGIDYPMGRHCRLCLFWANVDRLTHDPIRVAEPSMSAEGVLTALAREVPDALNQALVSADAHREVLIDPLLEALERGLADPENASKEDASLFSYALYLLAQWREPRAYPQVIRWLSLPDEEPFDIAGDIVTEDGGRILAGVCDGNLEPIVSLIRNRHADEWGRAAGVSALTLLAAWAEIPRTQVIERLLWLIRESRTTPECGMGQSCMRERGY